MARKAVILLSGGLDSSTCLAAARAEGFIPYALTVVYGQRHAQELEAARRVADHLGVQEHIFSRIDLRAFGASALTADMEVPKDRPPEAIAEGIPITYVPARNTIFLALALGWAEAIGAGDIFIGVNAVDYSGYPDCRPEFIRSFEQTANLATRRGVEADGFRIHAPLIALSKIDIIRLGMRLGVDYSLTLTCYDPDPAGHACGHCDACLLRLKAFADLGLPDPAPYSAGGT